MTLDHHDEATANAMRVVARGLIADAVSEYVTWAALPPSLAPLGDMDLADITNIAMELTNPPDADEYAAAVEHLTKRGQR